MVRIGRGVKSTYWPEGGVDRSIVGVRNLLILVRPGDTFIGKCFKEGH